MVNIQLTPEQAELVLSALRDATEKAFNDGECNRWMDLTELAGSITTQAGQEEGR